MIAAGTFAEFVAARFDRVLFLAGEHLVLVGISTLLAMAVALPLGIVAFRRGRLRGPILAGSGLLQTFPSLAMLALLQLFFGEIGKRPAVVALALYAVFPMVQNTLVGLRGVPASVVRAGHGLGMTERQQLLLVRLPLALPVILAGVRTAAVVGTGIATLSALIGAGGLGDLIIRGLRLNDWRLQVLGGVPAIGLALAVHLVVSAAERATTREARRAAAESRGAAALRVGAIALPLLVMAAGVGLFLRGPGEARAAGADGAGSANVRIGEPGTIRIGSKAFGEQFILVEMMAQLLEDGTHLEVERTPGLGGTKVCHDALLAGAIDLYPEYTGTGLLVILKEPSRTNAVAVHRIVADGYRERFDVEWLPPFGFSNAYSITVRGADADARGWRTVTDLVADAGDLTAGFTAEFNERDDGYPGLRRKYDLEFGRVVDMAPALMYRAARDGQVDVICAYTTDGRIDAYELRVLEDDRGFFPPYHAAPVLRAETLAAHPEIRTVLAGLAGRLDDATMRRLNLAIEEGKREPRDVARDWLTEEGLLGP